MIISYFYTCVVCVKGKLTTKVRNMGANTSDDVLELIHTDICGPITPLPWRDIGILSHLYMIILDLDG